MFWAAIEVANLWRKSPPFPLQFIRPFAETLSKSYGLFRADFLQFIRPSQSFDLLSLTENPKEQLILCSFNWLSVCFGFYSFRDDSGNHVARTVLQQPPLPSHVNVDLRGRRVVVSQHILYGFYADSFLDHQRATAVSSCGSQPLIKQHLHIKSFYGTSENAVYTQIWIAVCSFLILALARKKFGAIAIIVCDFSNVRLCVAWESAYKSIV